MAILAHDISRKSIQKVGRNDQFLLSKLRYPHETEFRPHFGQTVKCFANATSGATSIQVYPLIEPILPNTTLSFVGTSTSADVLVTEYIDKDSTVILCEATTGAVNAGATATTNNIEQVVTLANPIEVGAEYIDVVALTYSVEKNRPLKFSNGVTVKSIVEAPAGASRIWVEPVVWGLNPVGTEVVPTGDSVQLEEYIIVCSLNSVQRTGNAQTLTDYLFCLGTDALKDVTTRDRQFQVSGLTLPGDFGYERIFQQVESGLGERKAWIISSGDVEGNQWSCRVSIGQDSENKQINTYGQLSATFEVDGVLKRYRYPHVAKY